MNKTTVVKVLKASLLLLTTFGPLFSALNRYRWDISALLTPQYTPPKIGFNLDFKGMVFTDHNLMLLCQLQNLGEVEVELVGMKASAYTPDMQPLAPANLEDAVVLNPNSTQVFNISLTFDDYALQKLSQYLQAQGELPLRISGEIYMRILGSSVTAPVEFTVRLRPEDLRLAEYGG